MAATQKAAPKFGSDLQEKIESFEALAFERFEDGRLARDALTPTEATAALLAFGWSEAELRRRLADLESIHRARQIVGTAADRKQASAAHEQAVAAEQALLDKNADIRRELDRQERQAQQEVNRLSRMGDAIRGGLGLLRSKIPQHVAAEVASQQAALGKEEQADLAECQTELHHLELMTAGRCPDAQAGGLALERSNRHWCDALRRIDRKLVTADSRGRPQVSEHYAAWAASQQKHIEALRRDAAELQKIVDEKTAEIEKLRDYYIT